MRLVLEGFQLRSFSCTTESTKNVGVRGDRGGKAKRRGVRDTRM